ncbi:MAG: signal peptidase I [Candidatus Yanofskybacteria bacterium RIFCSPLOWO2_02_FULL_43_10]|uniref:Signal peptidase I n=1 Tax=Candidatus Yanofskybacteria bacterium RIFCSPLOWO2_12_FULL_43_11b TaxID=1802710 RepID=A0A1F8H9D1_9BACT|nr:MAG: signal peptidase I [Candidatus Yanofskybacteria bacterium RIFCSPHIGHO2_01_FULL_43_32]OGN12130.1 MAG: signal peptidase I [Candidatus Yanofskybacteria bacterium RIFCSPHIGHO2_02_FULL_43_12]OGN18260.1 MAG: signal peptidase I [Candidatus Yanofskybacteria bacterium RIFCSPHIGHO2_12_FULL_43_11]OGN25221.1 MAG: signal peptidase I [Candidatus Yanofskybacteria bacterium RIFCSPLOWO2_01_FULL_43_46]OGN29263.1 MAG: signal peptidase I [Candidatus Yanofskybacteria bacterium RIFCSPLOWO2_02_FULL_43_10]OGN
MNEEQPQIPSAKSEVLAFVWETIKVVVISLAIILPIRYYLVQPFFVKGASMEPNFEDGDYLLVNEISYRFSAPERGDVVIFRYPVDPSQFFIKRIIGLPDETVEIKGNTIMIYNKDKPGGFVLDESYLDSEQKTLGNSIIKLDDNEYFVLGDNRLQSSDSRRWGPVNKSLITGKAFLRPWPFTRTSLVRPVYY